MPTLIRSYVAANGVNPDASRYQYVFTSLANWWASASIRGDIVARDEVHIVEVKGEVFNFGATPVLTMAAVDATVDATHFYTIQPAPDAEFRGDLRRTNGRARFTSSTAAGTIVNIAVQYTIFKRFLFFEITNPGAVINIGANDCKVLGNGIRNILKTSPATSTLTGISVSGAATNFLIASNVIYNLHAKNSTGSGAVNCLGIREVSASTGGVIHNNVVGRIRASHAGTGTGTARGIRTEAGSAATIYNSYAFGSEGKTTGTDLSLVGTFDYNASGDSTAVATHGLKNVVAGNNLLDVSPNSAVTASVETLDAHLQPISILRKAGFDIRTLALFYEFDVDGEAWEPVVDIGADNPLSDPGSEARFFIRRQVNVLNPLAQL